MWYSMDSYEVIGFFVGLLIGTCLVVLGILIGSESDDRE